MTNKIDLTRISLISAGLLAATIMFAPGVQSVAQERSATSTDFSAQQQQDNKGQSEKAAPAARPAPQRAAPQTAAPRMAAPQRSAPRTVTQTKATSRVVTQPRATSRAVTQRKVTSRAVTQRKTTSRAVTQRKATSRAVTQRKATSRAVTQRKVTSRAVTKRKATSRAVTKRKATSRAVTQRKATSRAVTQRKATSRAVTQQKAAPRVVTPKGTRTVTASRLRGVPTQGVSSAVISGHNYSAWRSGHRVRHGRGWRTFVALSALGAIAIGSSEYYPYAYISAPENYCEGLTEDGCELMWQDVETIEGDIIPQCVAYCPWQ